MVGPGLMNRAAGRKPLSFCALPGSQPLLTPAARGFRPPAAAAAPSHEHCGAPRVCNAEPRQRAAGAGSARRERGGEGGTREGSAAGR